MPNNNFYIELNEEPVHMFAYINQMQKFSPYFVIDLFYFFNLSLLPNKNQNLKFQIRSFIEMWINPKAKPMDRFSLVFSLLKRPYSLYWDFLLILR